jgi:hypothetical protein
MQLLNILFEDPKGNEIAIAAIRRSKVWSTVVHRHSNAMTEGATRKQEENYNTATMPNYCRPKHHTHKRLVQ